MQVISSLRLWEVKDVQRVLISLVNTSDRDEVDDFIACQYLQSFGTKPSQIATVFVARRGGSIVGTLAVILSDDKGELPVRILWKIGHASYPGGFSFSSSMQYDRWVSDSLLVSKALLYTCTFYALQFRKKWGFCEMREKTKRIATLMGVRFCELDARPLFEFSSKEDRNFYFGKLKPHIYLVDLEQILSALKPAIEELIRKGKVELPF